MTIIMKRLLFYNVVIIVIASENTGMYEYVCMYVGMYMYEYVTTYMDYFIYASLFRSPSRNTLQKCGCVPY